jgi:hypothetical protein
MTPIASCIIVRARASIEWGKAALNRDRTIEGLEQTSTTESTNQALQQIQAQKVYQIHRRQGIPHCKRQFCYSDYAS